MGGTAAEHLRKRGGTLTVADGAVGAAQKIVDHGPDAVRYNVVVLGDGYRVTEMAKYHTDVQAFVDVFRHTAPFGDLWCGINIHRIDVASTDSGADDPVACGDGSAKIGIGRGKDAHVDARLPTARQLVQSTLPMIRSPSITAAALALALAAAAPARAEDLLQIYREAQRNDPTLAAARANWEATQERVPQARAGLLPNVSLSASTNANYFGTNVDSDPRVATKRRLRLRVHH